MAHFITDKELASAEKLAKRKRGCLLKDVRVKLDISASRARKILDRIGAQGVREHAGPGAGKGSMTLTYRLG